MLLTASGEDVTPSKLKKIKIIIIVVVVKFVYKRVFNVFFR